MTDFKKKAQMNKFVIGAIIFAILIFLIIMLIKGQTGNQGGLLDNIFKLGP